MLRGTVSRPGMGERRSSGPSRDAAGAAPWPTRDRAVSTVVGTVLLVAIAVLLAAVVGTLAMAMEEGLEEPAPTASFETTYDPAGTGNGGLAYVNITFHSGEPMDGDRVYVVDDDGDRERWVDIWTGGPDVRPGQSVHVDGRGSDCELDAVTAGAVYRVVWVRDDGSQVTIARHEVESAPDTPGGPHSC